MQDESVGTELRFGLPPLSISAWWGRCTILRVDPLVFPRASLNAGQDSRRPRRAVIEASRQFQTKEVGMFGRSKMLDRDPRGRIDCFEALSSSLGPRRPHACTEISKLRARRERERALAEIADTLRSGATTCCRAVVPHVRACAHRVRRAVAT